MKSQRDRFPVNIGIEKFDIDKIMKKWIEVVGE